MFAVGESVRVLSKDRSAAYRAIISLCSAGDSYDVILAQCAEGQSDEELGVPSDRISPIETFEKDAKNCNDADILKGYGNTLFTLKDYSAAMEYYKRAINATTHDVDEGFTVGQCVLVSFRESIDYHSGIISDVDLSSSEADVMFDDPAMEEEVAVPFDRLHRLAAVNKDRLLQRSVYMNMARSVLKKEQKGWAIKYSSIAIAIARHLQLTANEDSGVSGSSTAEVNKMLADGYYFRAKALLMACRPKFASQDCRSLLQYDATKAAALQKEIQSFRERTAKSNRKLARDIASWVESAMSTDSRAAKGARGGTTDDEDMDILDEHEGGDGDGDGDEGEESSASAAVASQRRQMNPAKMGASSSKKSAGKESVMAAPQATPWSSILLPCIAILVAALIFMFPR